MTRLRVRISTLMLLVVIAALTLALVAERTRSSRLLADPQLAEMVAREEAARAEAFARSMVAAPFPTAKPTGSAAP